MLRLRREDRREPSLRPDGTYDFSGIGRLSRVPAVAIERGAWGADRRQLADVQEIVGAAGLGRPRVKSVDMGRGAAWEGLVVEFAEAIDLVGGVAATFLLTATAVRKVHRRLSRRQGHAAAVSLGAAEYLAAADLVDRVAPAQITKLVGSGDVRREAHDASFIGGDAYWMIFEAGERLHHYQVDAFGRVTYVGDAPLIPDHADPPPPPPPDDD